MVPAKECVTSVFARTHKSNERTPTMGPPARLSPKQKTRTAMAFRQFSSKAASAKKNTVGDAHWARPHALTLSSQRAGHEFFPSLLTDHATWFFFCFVHVRPLPCRARTATPHAPAHNLASQLVPCIANAYPVGANRRATLFCPPLLTCVARQHVAAGV
jgi:hypothetical protein